MEDTRASSAAGREITLPSPVTCPVTCLSVGSVHFSLGCVPLFISTRLAGQETTGWATATTSATVEQVRNLLSFSPLSLCLSLAAVCVVYRLTVVAFLACCLWVTVFIYVIFFSFIWLHPSSSILSSFLLLDVS